MVVIGIVAFAPVVVASMVTRYRAAGPVERAQLRWFVAAVGLTLTSLAIVGIASTIRIGFGQAPIVAFGIAASTVPIAIGIAILRYRLYEIDRIVSRTIGWLAVTTIVGSVFVLVVVGLQTVLSRFMRRNTLAVATLHARRGRAVPAAPHPRPAVGGPALPSRAIRRRAHGPGPRIPPPRRSGPRPDQGRRRRHRGRGPPTCGCRHVAAREHVTARPGGRTSPAGARFVG